MEEPSETNRVLQLQLRAGEPTESQRVLSEYLDAHVDRQIERWLADAPDQNPEEYIEQLLNNQPEEYRKPDVDARIREGLKRYTRKKRICWDIDNNVAAACEEHEDCRRFAAGG